MSDRETLEQLKVWIMSCGTEEAGKYEPPSEKDAVAAIDAVLEENERLRAEINLRKRIIDGFPFCSDHRDKQHGKDCLACRIDAALALYGAAMEILPLAERMAEALRGKK